MNHLPMVRRLRAAGAAIALTSLAAHASAQFAVCAPHLTSLELRMLLAAQKSPEELRRFIDIRRAMLQLDVASTQAWAAATLKACSIEDAATLHPAGRPPAQAAARPSAAMP